MVPISTNFEKKKLALFLHEFEIKNKCSHFFTKKLLRHVLKGPEHVY